MKLSAEAAARVQGQAASPAADEVLETTRELGIELRPVHPGIPDPELASYFTVEAPDRAAAERIAARLQECGDVEAAYYSPAPELPSPDPTDPP